jgi:hypothetical protein
MSTVQKKHPMSDFLKTSNYNSLQVGTDVPTVKPSSQPSFQSVQFGEAPAAEEQRPTGQSDARMVGGTTRIVADGKGGMTVESVGVQRASTATPQSTIDTARSTSGSRQSPDQVRDSSLVVVNVGGKQIEMRADMAAREGYLKRASDGTFSDPHAPAAATPQAQQQQQQEQRQLQDHEQPQQSLSDAKLEQDVETLVSTSSGTDQVALANGLINGNGLNEAAVERLASQAGKSVEEVRATVDGFVSALTDQAEAAVAKVAGNVNFQDWIEQARATDPEALTAAMRMIAYNRSPQGFADLAQRMVENADVANPQEVLAACQASGIAARQLPSGRVVLTIPGKGQVEMRTALRMGWITVSR